MVFRIAETSSCLKNERKFFNKKNRKDQSCWVEKGKANTKWENFSDRNFPESDSKGYFVCPGNVFTSYLFTKLHRYLQKKQIRLRSSMSVEVPMAKVPQENCKRFWYF